MRGSALHRNASLALVALVAAGLLGVAATTGSPWGLLVAMPMLVATALEASLRRSGAATTATTPSANATTTTASTIAPSVTAGSASASPDAPVRLDAVRTARGARSHRELSADHLAPVVHVDFRRTRAA